MKLALGVAAALCASATACMQSAAEDCGDGAVCPAGTTCKHYPNFTSAAPPILVCVANPQIAACAGDGADCTKQSAHACYDGACLPSGCGNRVPDPGELCDDGNVAAGDGCSPDCTSDERCGTGHIDPQLGEQCDDGNTDDHDGCAGNCRDEALAWTDLMAGIGPVVSAQPAYDGKRDTVVIFGGEYVGDRDPQTTWEFHRRRWVARRVAAAPTTRHYGQLAYAADRDRTVLFSGTEIADTWEYDGSTWTQRSPAHSPPARNAPATVYDPIHHRVVMTGGNQHGATLLSDTWAWDGTDWTELDDGTGAVEFTQASLGFDPVRGVVVAFGTSSANSGDGTHVYELGAGGTWTAAGATYPTTFPPQTAAWDPIDRVFVASPITISSLLTYDPVARTWGSLESPDPDRGDVLPLGPTRAGELLAVSGDAVFARGADRAWRTVRGPMLPTSGTAPIFGFDLASATDLARRTTYVVSDGIAWLWAGYLSALVAQPPVRLHANVAVDRLGHLIEFGGYDNAGTPQSDTFVFDGAAWTTAPAPHPPSRAYPAMALDAARGVVVLYDSDGVDATLWEWDGAAWTARAEAPPPAINDASLAYDVARARSVLVSPAGDATWTWDGSAWTEIAVAHPPGANGRGLVLAYDSGRARVMGYTGISVFSFDGADWHVERVGIGDPEVQDFTLAQNPEGAGVLKIGGHYLRQLEITVQLLRWDSTNALAEDEACDGTDRDGDGLAGCADPDCACAATCGDAACAATESPLTCPSDCMFPTVCGDTVCTSGETCAGDCTL